MPDGKTLKGQARVPLGIVVERRAIDDPWIDHRWNAVAFIPGAAPLSPQDKWTLLGSGRWAFGDSRGMDAMVSRAFRLVHNCSVICRIWLSERGVWWSKGKYGKQ